MTVKLKETTLILIALTAWSVIFIDESMDEGPIIKFVFTTTTSNLKHKFSDFASIASLVTSVYFVIRQDFRRMVFLLIYTVLFLNILRHVDFSYTSWVFRIHTILPTLVFVGFSFISIVTMNREHLKTGDGN